MRYDTTDTFVNQNNREKSHQRWKVTKHKLKVQVESTNMRYVYLTWLHFKVNALIVLHFQVF